MNRIYQLIVFMVLAGVIVSCNKTYESVPLGQQVTPDLAFDPRDSLGKSAMSYLLNTYLMSLPNGHNRIDNNYLDAASDDAVTSVAAGLPAVQAMATGAYTATNTNGDDDWARNYSAIRNATVFIVNINTVPMLEKLPNGQSGRSAYRSEARFLRAWLYFELMKRYGGVPLLGDTIRQLTDNAQLPRNTFEQCVNYIVSECDNIKDSLRTAAMVNGSTYGRITKGAAMALKAEALLFAASPLYNGGNIDNGNPLTGYASYDLNRWKLAADAAKDIIDGGEYKLMPVFKDIFTTQAAPVGTNTETIFWVQVSANIDVERNNAPVGFTSAGGKGLTSPTQNLVDAFPTDSGLAITDPASGYNPTQPYDHRDPRLHQTVFHNGSLWLNRPVETFDGGLDKPGGSVQQTRTGYYMRKFMGPFESVPASPPNYSNTVHDFIYYRYAGVLLAYAEASNEFSGPSADVYNALYALRQRAGINPGPDNTYGLKQGMTQEEMRAAIRNERRIELAFEEHRYWDLRRWKIAGDVYNTAPLQGMDIQLSSSGQLFYNPINVLQARFRDPQMYFYPIPYNEVVRNPQMKQNPLW